MATQAGLEAMKTRVQAEATIAKARIEAAATIEAARLRAGLDHDAKLKTEAMRQAAATVRAAD